MEALKSVRAELKKKSGGRKPKRFSIGPAIEPIGKYTFPDEKKKMKAKTVCICFDFICFSVLCVSSRDFHLYF